MQPLPAAQIQYRRLVNVPAGIVPTLGLTGLNELSAGTGATFAAPWNWKSQHQDSCARARARATFLSLLDVDRLGEHQICPMRYAFATRLSLATRKRSEL